MNVKSKYVLHVLFWEIFCQLFKKEKNLIATFPYWFWLGTNFLMFK